MEVILYYLFLFLVPFAVAVVCGYGLLKMGRAINLGLRKGRDRRWIMALVGLLGVAIFCTGYWWALNREWTNALSGLFLVPALVTFINYRGK